MGGGKLPRIVNEKPPGPAGPLPEPVLGAPSVRAVDIRTSIRPTVAEVDLGALRCNVGRLRAILGPGVGIFGVVKADAYGHGAVAVARVLGPLCQGLAVSLAEEGLELRQAGIAGPILVLGAYYDRYHSEILEAGLTPVVYDPADLDRFGAAPSRRGAGAGDRVDIHLKADTGMNRLGVLPADLVAALDRIAAHPRLRLSGFCTHFASADVADPDDTREQLRRFSTCLDVLDARGGRPALIHAANSAAAVRFAEARFGGVRPGLALYGALPSQAVNAPGLVPVLSLRTKIMALHQIPVGAPVSYGGRWRATRPSRVATLPVGYADGYPRHVNGAMVLVHGRRVPVTGNVCMDMLMIDVTDVPQAQVGDVVTLMGRDGDDALTMDDLAAWAGTVNYEILCGLSKRVPRIYVDGGAA